MRVVGSLSAAFIRLGPINAPTASGHRRPNQALLWGSARMVVKRSSTFIEPASVPRIGEPELLKVEMMAKLVTERTQKCAERCDLFAYRRPHPYADQLGVRRVIAK